MPAPHVNELTVPAAAAALEKCCGASRWRDQMVAARPFVSVEQMLTRADEIWWSLEPKDWKEAFLHHPKIGDIDSLRAKFASTKGWAAGEQSGCNDADEAVLQGLADGNKAYEDKFGYIFIVCATGKSAEEMLVILRNRLPNKPDDELRIAAGEQAKITKLRLEKLCLEVPSQPTC